MFFIINLSFETAQPFFKGDSRYSSGSYINIHPNGDRLLILQNETGGEQEVIEPRIKVIVNWEQEFTNK